MKKFLAGILIGTVLTGSVTVMAKGGKMIEVFYTVKKIVVDEASRTIDSKNKPFVYNGQAYVPLSFISENLGINAAWNAKTKTISIGEGAEEEVNYWSEHLKASYNKGGVKYTSSGKKVKDTAGETYTNYLLAPLNKESIIAFPLKGKYKEFKALLGTPDAYKDYDGANLMIDIDGEEIFNQDVLPEDLSEEISFDITDANVITFKVTPIGNHGGIALFNGEFIK